MISLFIHSKNIVFFSSIYSQITGSSYDINE